MILCTISQFSSPYAHLGAEVIAQYHITREEMDFLQTVYNYENRQNDNDLVYLIDRYERIFNDINVTRLVALKLLSYHYQIPPLKFDASVLKAYQAQQPTDIPTQTLANDKTNNEALNSDKKANPPVSHTNATQSLATTDLDSVDDALLFGITPDPMLQVASGHFVN